MKTNFFLLARVLFFFQVLSAPVVHSQDCSPALTNEAGQTVQGVTGGVSFNPEGLITETMVAAAYANWTSTCSNVTFPTISFDASDFPDTTYDVLFHEGTGPNGTCGMFESDDIASENSDFERQNGIGTIHLYRVHQSGATCDLGQSLTHELGHLLGIGDAAGSCWVERHNIMAGWLPGSGIDRSIQGSDCERAEESEEPAEEPEEPEEPVDPDNPPSEPCDNDSASSSYVPTWREGSTAKVVNPCGDDGGRVFRIQILNTPIVVNINRGGFRFTDIEHGVEFDMNGDGQRIQLSWTDPAEGDSFLGLDRNGNGIIDSGQELFGNFSAQPYSDSPNGYRALAVFDGVENGGNGDGFITYEDEVFSDLWLWSDQNQNGYSESSELTLLSNSGVISLNLNYVVSGRQDRFGNLMPYNSSALLEGAGVIHTTDVFFLAYEE